MAWRKHIKDINRVHIKENKYNNSQLTNIDFIAQDSIKRNYYLKIFI